MWKRWGIAAILISLLFITEVKASPYNECTDFNNYMKSKVPSFYSSNIFRTQGINSYNFKGTCSEVCEANVMNLLFDEDYTEQDFLHLAIQLNSCTIDDSNKRISGGQTPLQVKTVIESMGNITSNRVKADYKLSSQVPDSNTCAMLLSDNTKIIMAVNSVELWSLSEDEINQKGLQRYNSDHWIVLNEPLYSKGKLLGFSIIDSSGSMIRSISRDRLDKCVFGPTKKEISYSACVIVTKLD